MGVGPLGGVGGGGGGPGGGDGGGPPPIPTGNASPVSASKTQWKNGFVCKLRPSPPPPGRSPEVWTTVSVLRRRPGAPLRTRRGGRSLLRRPRAPRRCPFPGLTFPGIFAPRCLLSVSPSRLLSIEASCKNQSPKAPGGPVLGGREPGRRGRAQLSSLPPSHNHRAP